MRIFVTGASGWIGSAVVPELLAAGHEVVGLARSDAAAERVAALGAEVRRGELDDLDSLRAAAADVRGGRAPRLQPRLLADGRRGADRPRGDRPPSARRSRAPAGRWSSPPARSGWRPGGSRPRTTARPGRRTRASPTRGRARVRRARRAPVGRAVRADGARHRRPRLHRDARRRRAREGRPAYVGDGANRWPAVHRLDAARLVALAVETRPPGTVAARHRRGGRPHPRDRRGDRPRPRRRRSPPSPPGRRRALRLDRRVLRRSTPPRRAQSRATLLGWEPTRPGLIADLDAGHYFSAVMSST